MRALPTVAVLLALVATIPATPARTWYILPDGSGDAPTIQAGVDSAAVDDTVLLAEGHFTGNGNRNVDLQGKRITVRSESVDPRACILDCEGMARGFNFDSGEGPGTVIQGVTVTNGNRDPGGAVRCWGAVSPTIRECRFTNCVATMIGGAICCVSGASPRLENCVFMGDSTTFGGAVIAWADAMPTIAGCTFIGNQAWFGGAIECADRAIVTVQSCTFWGNEGERGGAVMSEEDAQVTLRDCTFDGNAAVQGGAGLACEAAGHAYVENTIIAFSAMGEAVLCTDISSATLTCCDLYGNAGGDWVGAIEDQYGINGNFTADPLFCDAERGDFTLDAASPCLDAPGCGQIGAYGQGCAAGTIAVDGRSPASSTLHFSVAPNPAVGHLSLRYLVPDRSRSRIHVYDVRGRVVRSMDVAGASGALAWDGADDAGRPLAPGVYFLRLSHGDRTETSQIALLRR